MLFLQLPSQKFLRNNSGINQKGWVEDNMNRNDNVYPFQVRKQNKTLITNTGTINSRFCSYISSENDRKNKDSELLFKKKNLYFPWAK